MCWHRATGPTERQRERRTGGHPETSAPAGRKTQSHDAWEETYRYNSLSLSFRQYDKTHREYETRGYLFNVPHVALFNVFLVDTPMPIVKVISQVDNNMNHESLRYYFSRTISNPN